MSRRFVVVWCLAAVCAVAAPKYGSNAATGKTFVHDAVRLYYEVYGEGEPLLVIHGNGGSIFDLSAQIDYFRKRYQVIAMDSRDHGRSSDSNEPLTYEKMTGDLAALLDHLHAPRHMCWVGAMAGSKPSCWLRGIRRR